VLPPIFRKTFVFLSAAVGLLAFVPLAHAVGITSFVASPTMIMVGESSSLTGVFANGTGVIMPGNLAVTSGTAVSVMPSVTTTYTLTVTNSAGTRTTASTVITVTPVSLGVNIPWVTDSDPTQVFADVMKQALKFGSTGSPFDEAANVDSLGWPTQDAGVIFMGANPGAWAAGTYALSFTGQSTVSSFLDNNVSVGPVTYNSATNTSTAAVTVGPAFTSLCLVFTNTRRTPVSAVGTGVTNVSLMRPTISGAPHAPGTLFTDRFLARLKYFTAMRMMEYLATNSSTEAVWTDRSIPAYASQLETPPHSAYSSSYITGACYEYAIQLANQTGKDLWLNIPHLAFGGTYQFTSTTWATNLALLLKYGSDVNGNPYTGPNGSSGSNPQPVTGPANPTLNPGLHVYLEWSNEFWSGVGTQTAWIGTQATAAIAAQDPDLDWDGDTNNDDLCWRINAKGVMLMANAFASVYGADAFGTVYRPIYGGELGHGGPAGLGEYGGLTYLDAQHGGANKYVWAASGAPYVSFVGDAAGDTFTAAQVIAGMQAYQIPLDTSIDELAWIAASENLPGGMVAYEGGQAAGYENPGELAAQTTPGMRGIITADLTAWFEQGGSTFFYYKLCSADMWGLATDISYDIDADPGYSPNPASSTEAQPKWGAIKQIAALSLAFTPTFSPGTGTYTSARAVTISSITNGASIAYTTDGSSPTESGGTVTNGILLSNGGSVSVNTTTTLNAIAFESGLTQSTMSAALYNIQSQANSSGSGSAAPASGGGGVAGAGAGGGGGAFDGWFLGFLAGAGFLRWKRRHQAGC